MGAALHAVLRKSFILKRRAPKTTLCQLLSPPLFACVLVLAYSYTSDDDTWEPSAFKTNGNAGNAFFWAASGVPVQSVHREVGRAIL